jgi:hypothetical protein
MKDFVAEMHFMNQMNRIDIGISLENLSMKDVTQIELNLIKCSVCKKIPSLPIKEVINCDIFLCYNCVEKHNKKETQKTCPICEKISVFKPPSQCEMLIFSKLKLKCKNKGCEKEFSYITEVNDLYLHEKNCKFGSDHSSIFEKPLGMNDFTENRFSVGPNNFCFECGMVSKGTNHSCIKYLCAKIINYEKFLNEEIEKIKDGLISLQKERSNNKPLTREDFFNKEENISVCNEKNNVQNNYLMKFNPLLNEKNQSMFLSHKTMKINNENDNFDNLISKFSENNKTNKKITDSVFTLKGKSPNKNKEKVKISVIITTSIFKLIEKLVLPNVKRCNNMSLIFKASENEFSAEKFHEACDGLSPTLVLVKDTEGNIFGGYNSIPWRSKNYGINQYDKKRNNFLFSLDKKRLYHIKTPTYSVDFDKNSGPCFGEDLKLTDKCNVNLNSSFLGKNYKKDLERDVNSVTNKNLFYVNEYEVFHLY